MSEPLMLFLIVGAAVAFFGGRLCIGICLPETHWLNSWGGRNSDGDSGWCDGGDGGD